MVNKTGSMLVARSTLRIERNQAAAGRPGRHRLVGDDFCIPALHRAGESDTGPDVVAAGAGFAVDLIVGVGRQLVVIAGDQIIQEVFVERYVDPAMLRFAGPVRQAAGGDERDAFVAAL